MTQERDWAQLRAAARAVAHRRGVPLTDVDDVAQTALERALRRGAAVRDPARFEAWVKAVAANAAIDWLRADRRRSDRQRSVVRISVEAAFAGVDDPEACRLTDCIDRSLRGLARSDVEAIRLKDLERRPFEEVAATLRLTVSGAKARVRRARVRLGAALTECRARCG